MIHARLALAALLGLVLLSGCGGGQPRDGGGTIVFSKNAGDLYFAVQPDGSGLTRLFNGSQVPNYYWAPDGTKVLVVPDSLKGSNTPYILDTVTHGKHALPASAYLDTFDPPNQPWSPDGKRLVLQKTDGSWVSFEPATAAEVALNMPYQAGVHAEGVVWTPDGKAVVYSYRHSIYRVPVDGTRGRAIASFPILRPQEPTLSADGDWVAFAPDRSSGLYVVRSNGTGLRLIDAKAQWSGMWSPDGDRLAFMTRGRIGVDDLATGQRYAVHGDIPEAWSPDGRWLLYDRRDLGDYGLAGGNSQLWVARLDGSDPHAVTDGFTTAGDVLDAYWFSRSLRGTPPQLPLVAAPVGRTIPVHLPIGGLTVTGTSVALSTGLGNLGESSIPAGAIAVLAPNRPISRFAVRGCRAVYDLVLANGSPDYVCDNSSQVHTSTALRVGRTTLLRAGGGAGGGSAISGLATDGRTVVFGVESWPPYDATDQAGATRIYELVRGRPSLVRTLPGTVDVLAVQGNRVLLERANKPPVVLSLNGGMKTYRVGSNATLALDGSRLVSQVGDRISLFDLASGRKLKSLRFGSVAGVFGGPRFQDFHGAFVVAVEGAQIHVLRLTDGREIVLDTPHATTPVFARFGAGGLFYAYNESYAKQPGRVGFMSWSALDRAISAHGVQAR